MNFQKYKPEKLPPPYCNQFTTEVTRQELTDTIKKELASNAEMAKFLSGYQESSHDYFLKQYAELKTSVLLESDQAKESLEFGDTSFKELADERLWDIQQKKLFDVQCLWRAEKIKLREVESIWDFSYWEREIKLCPFIDPITELDLERYILFLKSSEEDLEFLFTPEWQLYDEFRTYYHNESDGIPLPEWYEFHNTQTGNGSLLLLPDIRGEKEEFYRNIWRNKKTGGSLPVDDRPSLILAEDEDFEGLMKKLETPRFNKLYFQYKTYKNATNEHDWLRDAFDFLESIYEPVPIKAHHDWKQALVLAKIRYVNLKIAEALPQAFEEYKMKQDLGLPQQQKADEKQRAFYDSLKVGVLEGREINGEPRNFDF